MQIMRASFGLALIVFALGCGSHPRSPAMNRITGEKEVRVNEQLRFDALVKGDVALLDSLLDEDLSFVHADGGQWSKEELIEAIRSRQLVFESIEPSDVHVRLYGSAAIATGLSQMRLRSPAGVSNFRIRFTETYVRKDGRWLLAAWQATRVSS
jgi:hypothetical protein